MTVTTAASAAEAAGGGGGERSGGGGESTTGIGRGVGGGRETSSFASQHTRLHSQTAGKVNSIRAGLVECNEAKMPAAAMWCSQLVGVAEGGR